MILVSIICLIAIFWHNQVYKDIKSFKNGAILVRLIKNDLPSFNIFLNFNSINIKYERCQFKC